MAFRALCLLAWCFGFLLLGYDGALLAQSDAGRTPDSIEQQIAESRITESSLRGDIQFLADDLLEGRGPGTRGDLLAQRYIAAQFKTMGLVPGNTVALHTVTPKADKKAEDPWVQTVPLVGVTTGSPDQITLDKDGNALTFKNLEDYVLTCGTAVEEAKIEDAEILFAGYGIQAPEFQWDDFKDVDVRGKVLLVMNNDPADKPELFAGKTRLYYGRWDYKYAKAAQLGAAGVLIIHTTESAGYPFQVVQTSWTGEQMALGGPQIGRALMEGWLTENASQKLVQLAGSDLDELRAAAQKPDFRPVPLGIKFSAAMQCRVRQRTSGNVLGILPGSDPELSKQYIVFTAHHDHIGMSEQRDSRGDNIYNGAVDNASGVGSMLAIARAMASLPESHRPKRSILFASVAAEEQGLLGSEFMARNPPVPAGKMAAVINIDGINILGRTKDVVVIGKGKSDMDAIVQRLANWQNRIVLGDQFPDRGYYYRSDQFSLAKIGVPGVYLSSGVQVIGKPDDWGKQQLREWTENIYHQTSDEYQEDWNLDGAVEDARLLFFVGLQAANQPAMATWVPGDEFEAARKAAIQALENQALEK